MTHPMTPEQIAEGRALVAKATPGPFEHMEGRGLVRAIRGDLAVPIAEMLMPWEEGKEAPTVRHGGEALFRANSKGARTSQAFRREWHNGALFAAAVNAYPAYLDLCAEQANMPQVDGRAMTASEAKAAIGFLSARVGRLEEALKSVEAAWVSNNSEGDDYDEGYDDGLKVCCDIARAALSETQHG